MSDKLDEALADFDRFLEPEEGAAPDEGTPASEPAVEAEQPEVTPEPQAEAPVEEEGPTDVEAAEELLAGKFKTKEELEQAYTELQSTLGRQGSELGELRSTLEKLNENLAPREEEPKGVDLNSATVDWFDEQIEKNALSAAAWAIQNDPSGTLYDRAMDYAFEESPRQAAAFERRLERAELERTFNERLEQQTQPLQSMAQRNLMQEAWDTAAADLPDLHERSEQIMEAAKAFPQLAMGLQSDNPQERVNAVKGLYYTAAGMSGVQARPAPEVTPPQPSGPSARDVKLSGSVASQTQTADPEQISEGEAWARKFLDPVLDAHDHEAD